MDEYQDQATWYEVQIMGGHGRGRWIYAGDDARDLTSDTREGAERKARESVRADYEWRVVRRRGLA